MVAIYLKMLIFPAIFSSCLLALTSQYQYSNHNFTIQLHRAKLKVVQLESSLKEINHEVRAKDLYIEKQEKQIQESSKEINHLQLVISNLKSISILVDKKIAALEEEVRELWKISRKNNFDIHVLKFQAQEAEDRLQTVNSQVAKMSDIVSEQWIQIQQFEQALQLREMTILKAQRRIGLPRCSFLKFMNDLSGKYLPKSLGSSHSISRLRFYLSQILNQLGRFYSTMKEFHHQLQGLVRQEMERHKFTARLANQELVFFVASVLIIFPVFSAWILLSPRLHS